jgi:hypothetical protein
MVVACRSRPGVMTRRTIGPLWEQRLVGLAHCGSTAEKNNLGGRCAKCILRSKHDLSHIIVPPGVCGFFGFCVGHASSSSDGQCTSLCAPFQFLGGS